MWVEGKKPVLCHWRSRLPVHEVCVWPLKWLQSNSRSFASILQRIDVALNLCHSGVENAQLTEQFGMRSVDIPCWDLLFLPVPWSMSKYAADMRHRTHLDTTLRLPTDIIQHLSLKIHPGPKHLLNHMIQTAGHLHYKGFHAIGPSPNRQSSIFLISVRDIFSSTENTAS